MSIITQLKELTPKIFLKCSLTMSLTIKVDFYTIAGKADTGETSLGSPIFYWPLFPHNA